MAIPPGVDVQFTAAPGVFGGLVVVATQFEEGGADLDLAVANGTGIGMVVGTTADVPNLPWDTIAGQMNANPAVAAAVFTEGAPIAEIPASGDAIQPLPGGSDGLGLGQFFFAAETGPPPPAPPVMTLTFKGQKVYA